MRYCGINNNNYALLCRSAAVATRHFRRVILSTRCSSKPHHEPL